MQATKTMSDVRYEAYSEELRGETSQLNVCVEVGSVTVKTHALPRVDVEARLREVDLAVWQENGCVYVQGENSRPSQPGATQRRKAEILITLPAGCPTYVQVVTGTVRLQDLEAAARTHVITGQTTLNNLRGPIYATTVTGNIHFGGSLATGTHRFAATTGSVRLALDEAPDARVYAWATTGNVQCALPLSDQRRGGYFTGDHLYGVAGAGEGRIIAEVVTGSVHLDMAGATAQKY